MNKLIAPLFILLLVSCGAGVKTTSTSSADTIVTQACNAGEFDPQNITQLMDMISKMPKPIEVECILKSLKRPLYVYATSSKMSVQPAVSAKDPRIFIFKGSLVLSIVTSGSGSLVLEFSEMKSDVRSIKGEIKIPIVSNFTPADAFNHIINDNQTSCSGCHSSEQTEYVLNGVQIYSSKALKPSAGMKVTLGQLANENYLCQVQNSKTRRCSIYSSLLNYGSVVDQEFPAATPTLISF